MRSSSRLQARMGHPRLVSSAEWQHRSRDSRSSSSLRVPPTSFSQTTSISKFEAGTSDLHLSSSFSSLLSRAARSRGTRLQEVRRRRRGVLTCCCEKPRARAHEQRRSVGSQDGPGAETRARSHEWNGGSGFSRWAKQTAGSRQGVRGGSGSSSSFPERALSLCFLPLASVRVRLRGIEECDTTCPYITYSLFFGVRATSVLRKRRTNCQAKVQDEMLVPQLGA